VVIFDRASSMACAPAREKASDELNRIFELAERY